MPRPVEALIHADALAHNLARARQRVGDSRLWAVVKANAYGHGIERAYAGLRGADGFALLDLDEAQRLRALDWRGPILLLEGCFEARDLEMCSRLNLWHVVHDEAQIDWLAAHKTATPQRVFLKMNSGMNRLGFGAAAFRAAYTRLDALPQVAEVSLMTHFADADGERGIGWQMAAFEAASHDLLGERSLSNSAAILRHAGERGIAADWVRAGIMLYGSAPDHPQGSIEQWALKPAMTLRSRLIAIQSLAPGDSVGYGSRFVAEQPLRIGVAACGYADGYPRSAPTGTPVLVNGTRTRIVGRVSMDMVTIDLSALPDAAVGSEVTLWGHGPDASVLPIDEVAHAAGTLGYELMCALAPRVPTRLAAACAA